MSFFAKIENGIVTNVTTGATAERFAENFDGEWVEHSEDSSRKHRPNVGMSYDSELDQFIWPKPFESWVLNEETLYWEPPIAKPQDGQHYDWNEDTLSWELIISES